MLRDTRTSSPCRLSISEVRLSTGKKCSEINHRRPSPRLCQLRRSGARRRGRQRVWRGDGQTHGNGSAHSRQQVDKVGFSRLHREMVLPLHFLHWWPAALSWGPAGSAHLCMHYIYQRADGVHRAAHPYLWQEEKASPKYIPQGGLEHPSQRVPHTSSLSHARSESARVPPVPIWGTPQCFGGFVPNKGCGEPSRVCCCLGVVLLDLSSRS